MYEDPVLDELERQIDVSNQTLKASEAAWREARALVSEARAAYLPTLGLSASGTRSSARSSTVTSGGSTVTNAPAGHPSNSFEAIATAAWDVDLWGKIRRTVESQVANTQASEAELAAARLSAQAALATDYVDLRVADETRQLLDETVAAFQRSLTITQNQYKVGIVAKADVITAETQLGGAKSQQLAIGVTRATLEHAIAVLVGKAPGDFSLAPAPLGAAVPVAPTGVPSTLLERNPTVAAAERNMAAANAQIGVAIAAYFPDLTLTGTSGFAGKAVDGLFQAPNAVWSFGGNATATLFDFGLRSAQVHQARAATTPRSPTTARRSQCLPAGRGSARDAAHSGGAVRGAGSDREVGQRGRAPTLNEYKAGTVAHTTVVTAQATALADAQALLAIRQNRERERGAGAGARGGWDAATLGKPEGAAAQLAQTPGHTP